MSIAFSPSALVFYDLTLWPHDLPDDILAVAPVDHARILDELSTGRVLAADDAGAPVTTEPPLPSADELAARARRRRDQAIAEVQWLIERHRGEIALQRTPTLTNEDYLLVLQHVQDLRDLPEQDGFPASIDWPTLPPELLATGA
ncbi:hypothetical protein D3C77_248800 [compost metagenome]